MQLQNSEVTEMAVTTINERDTVGTLGEIRLSLASIVFLLILTIAAVLRFGYLGALPLAADEARQALLAWDFWQPALHSAGAETVSPAYFTFTTVLFALIGAGDAVARLAPAIFGILTVTLPWLWRSELGNAGAFAASILLAVSPTLNMLSTTAGGEAISVFAVLLFFIAWMRFQAGGGRRWLLTSGIALGLGLATSPLFFSLMFSLLLAALLHLSLIHI